MKKLILIILLVQSYTVFSQGKLKSVTVTDSFKCYDFSEEALHFYFDLPEVKNSQYTYHFRYKKSAQIIDIYSNDTLNFKGFIMNVAVQNKHKKKNQYKYIYFFEKVALKDSIAENAGKIMLNKVWNSTYSKEFEKSVIHNLLSESLSLSENLSFNLKKIKEYQSRKHGCVRQHPLNKETANIKSAVHQLDSLIDSQEDFFNNFKNKLKKGRSYDFGFYSYYIKTEKELKAWNDAKPIRNYLLSMKPQIDNSLKEQLDKLYNEEKFNGSGYTITFSKKGRLKSLKSNHETFISRLFNKNTRKDYREAKKLLKQVNLGNLELRYGFERIISFYAKGQGYSIFDYNLY
ncbi:hypothetical protein ABS768_11415 [Flavobacterium sp. ST-75]|uniref:Uncharacterized protein n=1 Tax=Flavobacterium rhizophilum TaxID=3163296 RepID=A0ABW8YFT2_9FLAO